jgi:hypothetical protein
VCTACCGVLAARLGAKPARLMSEAARRRPRPPCRPGGPRDRPSPGGPRGQAQLARLGRALWWRGTAGTARGRQVKKQEGKRENCAYGDYIHGLEIKNWPADTVAR